jgi:tetratricopeptide (TPR) repeat protein
MSNPSERPTPEAYVLSLLAEGKYEAAFEAVGEFGSGRIYAPDFSNHALRLMECGHAGAAADLFRKAIALDPTLSAAHCGLGVLHLRQNRHTLAGQALRQAVGLDPNSPEAQAALGIALCHAGKIHEAVPHLVRALELTPGQAAAVGALRGVRKALSHKPGGGRRRGRAAPGPSPTQRDALLARVDAILRRSAEADPDAGRPTLSVCLIVKNEESTLDRCLSSVQDAADEMVVVDTGSRDRTVEVARRHGAQVAHFEWCDDFAAARNYALGLATGDWILIMDADDEMEPGGAVSLRRCLDGRPQAEVCSLRTRIPHGGEGEAIVEHPRLFRNHMALRYTGVIHEQLVYPDGRWAAPQAATGIAVYHHGYLDAPEDMEARHARNLRILRAQVERQPDDAWAHFNLGKEYYAHQKFEEALPCLRRALELAAEDRAYRVKAYAHLGAALTALSRAEEAERIYSEALERYPDNAELWFGLGEVKRALGREHEAARAYEAATRARFGAGLAFHDFTCRDLKPRARLAEIALAHGRLEEAEAHWRKARVVRGDVASLRQLRRLIDDARARTEATHEVEERIAAYRARLALQPDDLRARADLVAALIALGRTTEAEGEAAAAARFAQTSPEVLNLQGTALAACGRLEEAARVFARAAEHETGSANALCKLAAVQRELGRVDEARDAFERALAADEACIVAYVGLGELRSSQGEWDEALQSYEAAVKTDPEHVGAWLGLARSYLEKQVVEAAAQCYEMAVRLSGGAPEVLAEVGRARDRIAAMAEPAFAEASSGKPVPRGVQ